MCVSNLICTFAHTLICLCFVFFLSFYFGECFCFIFAASTSVLNSYYDIDLHGRHHITIQSALQAFFDDRISNNTVCPNIDCSKHIQIEKSTERLPYVIVLDVEWNIIFPIPDDKIEIEVNEIHYTYEFLGQINWTPSPLHFTTNFIVGREWYEYDDLDGCINKIDCLQVVKPPMKPNSYWYHMVHFV